MRPHEAVAIEVDEVVRIVGDLDLAVAAGLRTTFETALARCPWIIVDLRRTGAVDSVGLGVLIAARQARMLAAAPTPFPRPKLDEAARVAAEIRARGWV